LRLLRVVAVLGVVLILASLLVVSIARARRRSYTSGCAGNLRVLWTCQMNYAVQHGGPLKAMPDATGSEFWRALEKTSPPLIEENEREIFLCRHREEGRVGEIDYFGPGVPVQRLANADPVGCDDPRNHGGDGGNVLRKSGDVLEYTAVDLDTLLKTHPTPPRR